MSRGALNARLKMMSCFPGSMTSSVSPTGCPMSAVSFLYLLDLVDLCCQSVKSVVGDFAVAIDPLVCFLQRSGLQTTGTPLGLSTPFNQAGPLEDLEVFGYRLNAHVERPGDLVD